MLRYFQFLIRNLIFFYDIKSLVYQLFLSEYCYFFLFLFFFKHGIFCHFYYVYSCYLKIYISIEITYSETRNILQLSYMWQTALNGKKNNNFLRTCYNTWIWLRVNHNLVGLETKIGFWCGFQLKWENVVAFQCFM